MDKKKPRKDYVYARTVGKVSELEVIYNTQDGSINFGGEVENVYSAVTYDRKKGEKILSRIPQGNEGLFFDQPEALEKNFDILCAVDTNTLVLQGKRVSVTGVALLVPVWVPEAKGLTKYWKFDVPFCLEFVELKMKPENFGWVAALEQMHHRGVIDLNKKIGLIVDSDLGNIPDFNARKKPVEGQWLLPENTQLIYASADVGKEYIANKAIGVADSVSAQCLDAVNSGKAPFNEKRVDSPFYEGFRFITPNVVEY